MAIEAGDFKTGLTIIVDGDPWQVLDFQHVKPGKGAAILKTKMKNLKTGSTQERNFNASTKFEAAPIEKKIVNFSYSVDNVYTFMDMETFETYELTEEQIGFNKYFIVDGLEVSLVMFEGMFPTFENGEIHGTIDFICGAGDVFFNHCLLVTEKRRTEGGGRDIIAAPRTSKTAWGYVFSHCTIRNDDSEFLYARGWREHPRCVWLYTTLETPEMLQPTRFEPKGMRTIQNDFYEYGTTDGEGRDITPRSNVVTFTLNGESHAVETILTEQQAAKYTLKNVFPDWQPQKNVRQLEKQGGRLKRKLLKE